MTGDNFRVPRGYLASRLEELWQAAGAPSLDVVARHARGASSTSKLTGKKISAWKTGTNVPHAFTELESVLRFLIHRARPITTQDVTPGLYDERQWAKWWREARRSSARPSADDQISPLGQPIGANLNPFDLEIHHAIDGENGEVTSVLPPYIARVEDSRLRQIVDQAKTHNSIAVLVGGSSTGKTRMCWEAIQDLAGWRLWHPLNPGRTEALLDALERRLILPRTVLWLNEIQYYLNTPGSDMGERIAAGLRELLRDRSRTPILALGTIWPEYWDFLTRWPAPLQRDDHAQARQLLTGRGIVIPDSFEEVLLSDLPSAVKADVRIAKALSRSDKRVTQFLAGAFELLSRYNAAPLATRALMDTAIDARRFSFGELLSESLLKDASSGYISDHAWNELHDDWFETALEYARQPCLGVSGPLTRIRSRSARPLANTAYQLADFLEEYGRRSRSYVMPPETFWKAIVANTDSSERLIDLAYEVNYRGRFRLAAWIYLMAADAGEVDGFLFLADHRRLHSDITNVEILYRAAIKKGSSLAYIRLAEMYEERGDRKTAKQILDSMLNDQNADLKHRSDAWEHLIRIYGYIGEVQGIRTRLEYAAESGDTSAMAELRRLDGVSDDSEDSEIVSELKKHADAFRKSHYLLQAAREQLVEASLADKVGFPQLVEDFRKKAAKEELEGIHTYDLVMLGTLLAAHGQIDTARIIFLKAINLLDEDAYYEGKIPALVEFVNVLKMSGDTATADRAWKYGLEPDGSVSFPWDVRDQAPSRLLTT